jgi:hypothetical protein
MYGVLYGATCLTAVPSIHPCMLPFSLLFPGGFEFAPGPWVGNSWCLLAFGVGQVGMPTVRCDRSSGNVFAEVRFVSFLSSGVDELEIGVCFLLYT